MVALSAFADEISKDFDEQVSVLAALAVGSVDVRSVGGRNVVHLTAGEVRALRNSLDGNGLGVTSLASPIGKAPADLPLGDLRAQIEHAAVLAHVLGTSWVRVFSFYPPGLTGPRTGADPPIDTAAWQGAVLERLATMSAWASEAGVVLLVENDRGTYAETIAGAAELLTELGSAHLGLVLDPANFLQCGQNVYPDGYRALAEWVRHVHVKDVASDGTIVVAGQGGVGWPDLLRALRDDGYTGHLSLEPHLAGAGQFGGFTGPDLFPRAARALRDLLARLGWDEEIAGGARASALDGQEA